MSLPESSRRTIGGDFEIDTLILGDPARVDELTRGIPGRWTASGRGAFGVLLSHLVKLEGISNVHLPSYLCGSLLEPVQRQGLKFSFYPVDETLGARPDPPPGAVVLLIHYFGRLNPATESLRLRAGKDFTLIEDFTHSLLSDWNDERCPIQYAFFSARKVLLAPLGGWLSLPGRGHDSIKADEVLCNSIAGRIMRGRYLRSTHEPVNAQTEALYISLLREAEDWISKVPGEAALPQLGAELIAGNNLDSIRMRRRRNWCYLADRLPKSWEIASVPRESDVPLGFVVRVNERDVLRSRLAARRIFCPVHWPLPPEVETSHFPTASLLSSSLLTLPIDQRYSADDLDLLLEAMQS